MTRRGSLLLACVGAGLLIGFAGHHWTGDQRWFLALPAAMAAGWLFVADPEQCLGACRRGRDPRGKGERP